MAEMGGIVGLRDVLVVAPAASFHPQHQHQHHQEAFYSAAGTEHPIIPLLTAAPCLMGDDPHDPRGKASGIHLWQQHHHHAPSQNPNPNPYLKKPMPMLDSTGILSSGSGAATCQDCGNQAKKDCSHNRCRTCCKSRGFDCSTHVKSTWVPAARRRERQLSASGGAPAAGSSVSTSAPKKPRLLSSQTTSHTSTSNNTTRSYDTSSSHRDAGFRENLPGHVRAPAMFKCVRVSSMDDDGEDEYAYQAMVKIGGHVFKGFLYDQGMDDGREEHSAIAVADTGANTTTSSAIPNISELHLGGASTRSSSATAAMVTSDIYGSGGGAGLLGGTAYDEYTTEPLDQCMALSRLASLEAKSATIAQLYSS